MLRTETTAREACDAPVAADPVNLGLKQGPRRARLQVRSRGSGRRTRNLARGCRTRGHHAARGSRAADERLFRPQTGLPVDSRVGEESLAGKSTLNRLELDGEPPSRD